MNPRIKKLTMMAMLTALAVVLITFVHFPIFPAAPFLQYDPGDVAILVGTFAYGPLAGLAITVVASFIQAFMLGGDGPYGFLMHVIATGTMVLAAGLLYRMKHTKGGAALGLACAIIGRCLVMIPANYLITPYFMGLPVSAVDEILLPAILPFNLIIAGVNACITFLVYKAVSRHIIHGENWAKNPKTIGEKI